MPVRLRGRGALALPSSPARGRHRPAARRAGLTASGHRCCPSRLQAWVTALTPLDPRNWQILVRLGRNKKLSADLGTLEEYRQEVKSMNKMS